MATSKRITPQELPKLISAAVEKALAQHPVNEAQLSALAKSGVRIGIIPVQTTHPIGGKLPPSIGFVLRELEQLENPATIAIEPIRE